MFSLEETSSDIWNNFDIDVIKSVSYWNKEVL